MEKSKGHIAFIGNYEYYLSASGDLYRAHVSNVIASDTGRRHGRFEASAHMVDKHPLIKLIKKGGREMLIGVVLTCTAHGKPVWRVYDVNRESPEDVLVYWSIANPPPYRVIGPYEVPSDDETVVKEAVANDPYESVDLDDPKTWFPYEDWIDRR